MRYINNIRGRTRIARGPNHVPRRAAPSSAARRRRRRRITRICSSSSCHWPTTARVSSGPPAVVERPEEPKRASERLFTQLSDYVNGEQRREWPANQATPRSHLNLRGANREARARKSAAAAAARSLIQFGRNHIGRRPALWLPRRGCRSRRDGRKSRSCRSNRRPVPAAAASLIELGLN